MSQPGPYTTKKIAPELDASPEWGGSVPDLPRCEWEEQARDPGYSVQGSSELLHPGPDAGDAIQHNPGFEGTMHEWKAGQLHSGSKKGPVVTSQKQALAIAFSQG